MVSSTVLQVLLVVGGLQEVLSLPAQVPMALSQLESPIRPRKLHGRFLHLTDMHPDPFYRAGEYGFLYGECDSPLVLTNYTLDYLEKNWADQVDFVIWTGDSARHDNDRKLPRTLKEIYELNRHMGSRMEEIFTKRGVPVIPSIGNNDVWPHNIMLPGPNDVTFEFSSIWKSFVPFHSYQVFQRGAYYSVEVIPDALAVVALNTMYFFDSNKAVGGCDPKDPEDPGNLQLDWLQVQLDSFRSRGMQAWISGHVPPSARNYHTECHVRYVELSLRYQDTILGHLYGHMNADHFFLLDATDLRASSPPSFDDAIGTEIDASGKHKELYTTLLKSFSQLTKKSNRDKLDVGALAVVNVAPSVVPNPYLPSFRIFAYNLTGTAYRHQLEGDDVIAESDDRGMEALACDDDEDDVDVAGAERTVASESHDASSAGRYRHLGDYVNRTSWCPGGKEDESSWACQLSDPWHSSPRSPSRTNRLYSPVGFAQYYLPDMNGTAKHPPKWKLEYVTFEVSKLHPAVPPNATTGEGDGMWYPIPLKQLPKSLRQANVTKSKFAPYKMADLTIPSWLRLVERLGRAKHAKLRRKFKQYMYMGANEEL